MAGHADHDNTFSDDDWDLLPPSVLAELESHAIRSTQAANHNSKTWREVPPSSDYGDDFEDEDLDDAVVIDEARSAPAVVPALHRNPLSQSQQRGEQLLHQPLRGTSSTGRSRAAGTQHQPNRDRLPIPSTGPHKRPAATVVGGSQAQVTDDAAALRRQLEEVRSPRSKKRMCSANPL